jgi:hypothetical protein
LSDGTPYAIEEVYLENGEFESYRVEFYLLDTSGTIDRDGGTITINYRAVNEWKSGTYPFQEDLMCGPCLVSYIHDNWERLMNGKSVRFHLPVMEYQRTVPFRFKKIRKSSYLRDGRVVLRMEIASFILGLLIGPVDFVFEEDSKRLVEIHGPSILRVEERGKWRSVKVDAYYTYERTGALQQVHLK